MAGRLERGEARLYRFPQLDKERPVLILTRGTSIRSGAYHVDDAGSPSEVALGPDDGLR